MIGSRYSADTFRVRDFLAKNRVLFTWLDLETDPQVDQLLKQFGVTEADTPVVACGHMLLLRNPSNRELADALGIRQPLEQTVYDLVVVGGRPGGAGGGGLRRLRGAADGGAGAHRARRAGRQQHAHRELPRLSHRHHRQRAGRAAPSCRPTSSAPSCPSPRRSPA